MKGLAMEIIFKWVILTVVGLVAIGMIVFFSDNIKEFLENVFSGNETRGGEIIESSSFSVSQLRTFIKACWDKYHGTYAKITVCYALKGDVSGVDTEALSELLTLENLLENTDMSKFDNTKSTTMIKGDGRKILVESLA